MRASDVSTASPTVKCVLVAKVWTMLHAVHAKGRAVSSQLAVAATAQAGDERNLHVPFVMVAESKM